MYTIVLASQKGGSGKTTLAGHLAVEAGRCGAGPVALVDTDPQGSLSYWWNARKAKEPQFLKAGVLDIEGALAKLRRAGVRVAVIDTPPAITESISRIVAHADLVIIPTRPSPHDLRAAGATVDIVERHCKALIFVINAATARARITGESAVALSQHGMVAPVTVHQRVDFAASMIDGRTVGEIVANCQSTREISDLWAYVQGKLSRIVRDPGLFPETGLAHLATNSLLSTTDDSENESKYREPGTISNDLIPIPPLVSDYDGSDRRSATGRPDQNYERQIHRPERRVNIFGRRQSGEALI
jgi:chromosome partitioning protein